MSRRTLRTLALVVVAVLALGASSCGNKKEVRLEAETEGLYVDVGGLSYQVQVSRQVNPADVEDRAYFEGLPASEGKLGPDETWFAVFIRAENEGDEPQPAAEEFEIVDTQENHFTPVELEGANPFAYRPGMVPPGDLIPEQDSVASAGPVQGSLLLFRVKLQSLANRPLEFKVHSPPAAGFPQDEGIIQLDV